METYDHASMDTAARTQRTTSVIPQLYETTLVDPEDPSGLRTARFLTIPGRSISSDFNQSARLALLRSFGLREVRTLSRASQLPSALVASMLVGDDTDETKAGEVFDKIGGSGVESADQSLGPLVRFAEVMAFSEVIPFEFSPPDFTSLANLFMHGSGMAVGGYAGLMLASGGTGLSVLVSIAAGIVICRTATGLGQAFATVLARAGEGVGEGLRVGLNERVLAFVRGESSPRSDAGPFRPGHFLIDSIAKADAPPGDDLYEEVVQDLSGDPLATPTDTANRPRRKLSRDQRTPSSSRTARPSAKRRRRGGK